MIDDPVFCGLAVLSTLIFLLSVRSFLKILPSMGDCIMRWKGSMDLEDSLQLSGSRTWIAIILFVPLCMVAYSNGLYHPDYFDTLSPAGGLAAFVGTMLAYLLLRFFLNWQLEMGSYRSKTFIAANNAFYNYIILLFMILFPTGAILNVAFGNEGLTRTVLLYITAFTYLLHIYRRGQIFASVCNPFTTFLYLCGLELLPTTALVLSAKLL